MTSKRGGAEGSNVKSRSHESLRSCEQVFMKASARESRSTITLWLPLCEVRFIPFQSSARSDMILWSSRAHALCFHSSVAQWQSIRLLTGGL